MALGSFIDIIPFSSHNTVTAAGVLFLIFSTVHWVNMLREVCDCLEITQELTGYNHYMSVTSIVPYADFSLLPSGILT